MRPTVTLAAAVLVASIASGDASALTCYVLFDRSDNVIYRDVIPPVDLSDAGRADRDAMRRRGEFLMFLESDQCPRLEFFTGGAGAVSLRLDDTMSPTPLEVTREQAQKPAAAAAPATTPGAARAPRKPAPKGG